MNESSLVVFLWLVVLLPHFKAKLFYRQPRPSLIFSAAPTCIADHPDATALLFPQTNSKADLASELETIKHRAAGAPDAESELRALKAAVDERDRSIEQMRQQMK